ncbi:MAG: hypothetical protein MK089_00110 [Phycisphaerales bacterium]|nr:hypothetical protein [Phycisphaerales bacterium]
MENGNQSGAGTDGPQPRGPRVQFINFGSDRMAEAFQVARRQPNWATRAAVLTFLIIIGIPILLLLLLATVAAAVVFSVLMSINWVVSRFSTSKSPEHGRRNVRVINRD